MRKKGYMFLIWRAPTSAAPSATAAIHQGQGGGAGAGGAGGLARIGFLRLYHPLFKVPEQSRLPLGDARAYARNQ